MRASSSHSTVNLECRVPSNVLPVHLMNLSLLAEALGNDPWGSLRGVILLARAGLFTSRV